MGVRFGGVLITIGLLLAAGCSSGSRSGVPTVVPSLTASPSIAAFPATAASSLPAALRGTWLGPSAKLTLTDCALGEECGRLVWDDGSRPLCRHTLDYHSGGRYHITFATKGNTFSCGYSGWSDSTVRLIPWADGEIRVGPEGYWAAAITLHR